MSKPIIEVRVSDEVLEDDNSKQRLSRALDEEIAKFDAWMQRHLGGRVINIEKVILKTYLAHKILGNFDDLETRPLDIGNSPVAKTG